MRVLILGGTAFLGRVVADAAVARGHEVTCLARGSAPPPDGVEFVRADRDADDGLAPVADRRWDAVVDVTSHPGQVRRAVRDLDTSAWVYVSSGNAYRAAERLEQDESTSTWEPLDGDRMEDLGQYGRAKVACEQAVQADDAPAAVVRAALIGGPGDESGRTGYWPWRFAHPVGDHVVVPADPDFPSAVIDGRDLADWIVTLAERRTDGVFNAAGPTTPLHQLLTTAAEASSSTATPLPVAAARLAELGVSSWMGPASLPLWIAMPDRRFFATLDTTRAREAGLSTRPLLQTFRDGLAYEETRTVPRVAGLDDATEQRVQQAVADS